MSREERFIQPVYAIHIIEKAPDLDVEAGKQRIADGEDPDAVWADIAAGQVADEAEVRALTAHEETPVHAAADRQIAGIARVVNAAFAKGRAAYETGGGGEAVDAVREALTKSLPPVLLNALEACGNAALGMLPQLRAAKDKADKVPSVKFKMSFDAANPDAAKWARDHGTQLAKDISETSRGRIREAVARQQETGEEAYDDILDAVGDEVRASMIARTEAMDAANEGLAQGWSQAVEEGLLTGDEKKEWIAAEGCCDDCDEVDGEVVSMDDDFSVGDDPPLHPNCRCTMGLVGT